MIFTLNVIQQMTGLEASECSCNECKNMCRVTPCIGTPEDIDKISAAGFENKLMDTTWMAGMIIGIPAIDMKQPKWDTDRECCSFLTDDGLCQLHDLDLKPSEGRLALHTKPTVRIHPAIVIALSWLNKTK